MDCSTSFSLKCAIFPRTNPENGDGLYKALSKTILAMKVVFPYPAVFMTSKIRRWVIEESHFHTTRIRSRDISRLPYLYLCYQNWMKPNLPVQNLLWEWWWIDFWTVPLGRELLTSLGRIEPHHGGVKRHQGCACKSWKFTFWHQQFHSDTPHLPSSYISHLVIIEKI